MTDAKLIDKLVSRGDMLAELRSGAIDRRELEERLGTSQTTVHRLLTTFEECRLVRRTDDGYVLTGVGKIMLDELTSFRQAVETAAKLGPLVDAIEQTPFEFDIDRFADATVTATEPHNPYRPAHRLAELIGQTETLHGAYKIVPNPTNVGQIHRRISKNEELEIVYEAPAAQEVMAQYPERSESLLTNEDVKVYIAETLPFGVTLFDDRIAVAAYDTSSGLLELLVDTDDEDARAWAETVYAEFRSTARQLQAIPE
ncbi:MAG: helix-turn-helix transcriptional regulator [Halobacteriota archaeon]